jgi:hypothetical protein
MYKQILGTFVRWALTAVSAWLISKGIISQEQSDAWMTELVIGIVGATVPLLWALWNRVSHRVGFLTALQLPAGSTPQDVQEVTKDLSATDKVAKALTTQEGS